MAQFTKCDACQNLLSDQATFCPKCGHPVLKTPTPPVPASDSEWNRTHPVFKTVGILLVAAFFIMIGWSWLDGDSKDGSQATPASPSIATGESSDAPISTTSAPNPSTASQSDEEPAAPKWIKIGDQMYAMKPIGGIPYASIVVLISQDQRSYYFLNGGSQLCAADSGPTIKGPIGNYVVNGNPYPYEAMCMSKMEFDAPMTSIGQDILRNAVESGRIVKATTALGDEVEFDTSGLDSTITGGAAGASSSSSPTPEN